MGCVDGDGEIEWKSKSQKIKEPWPWSPDLAKAVERVSLPAVWAFATHFSFPRKILRVLCGYFEHQRRVQFEGCAPEPLTTTTAILPGSMWSCLLLRIVLQDALSEVTHIFTALNLRVFVDDIRAPVKGRNKEVAEMAKTVMKKLKKKLRRKASNCQSLKMVRKERAR